MTIYQENAITLAKELKDFATTLELLSKVDTIDRQPFLLEVALRANLATEEFVRNYLEEK